MQYDDLYRKMQFAANCKWGSDSQFISHQMLHRPDPSTPTPTRPPLRRFALNSNGVKVAAFAPPVDMIMFASNHNVWEPTHNGNTSLLLLKTPNTEPTLNCRDVSKLYFNGRTSRRYLDHIVTCRDRSCLNDMLSRRVWGKFTY